MSFGAPLMLLFSLAAVPVIVLYILKVRQRRVVVPTLLFWDQVFEEKRPRSIWQRLRHLLSLLAQLLFIALLVFALAQPLLPWQVFDARHIVVVIDNGASMNGRRDDGTRLDEAKRRAHEAIDGLRFFDSMAIVTAGVEPRVVCGMTSHQRTLRETIDAIDPTDAPARIDDAVALAQRIMEDEDNPSIIHIGDQRVDDVTTVPITGDTDNVAITRFAVRRSLVDPLGYAILAEVTNFSDEPVECRIELDLEGAIIDVFPLSLESGETWSQMIEKASPDGGRLTARIDRADALDTDNTAVAILPRRTPHRVTLVTEGNVFLAKVFESIPLVELTIVEQAPADDADLVVFHRQAPYTLPAGNMLVIDPTSETDLWSLGEPLQSPLVAEQDKTSPLMAHVRLDNVYMPEARRIEPTRDVHVLAEAVTGEPIYFAIERDAGKVLVLSADLDQSDLPLRTAFPIMMTNALNWFADEGGELRASAATGSTVSLEGDADGTLVAPDGRERTAPQRDGQVIAGPFDQVGTWTLTHNGDTTPIACNLVSASESDLRTPDDFEDKDALATAGLGGRPLWFYLLLAACGLAAIEWWLYQRRWIT